MGKRGIEGIVLLLLAALPARGADRDSIGRDILPRVEIGLRPAYLLPTSPYFKGEYTQGKPAEATFSGHLRCGFRFGPETRLGQLYPHAVQGLGIGYHTFFNPEEIGTPLSVYVFQSSRLSELTNCLSIDYEWNFGISTGWKKYDPNVNPHNRVVGSKANAYIHLGMLLDWELSPSLNVKAGVGVTHFSNGNTQLPNAGVNTVGSHFGLVWKLVPEPVGQRTLPAVRFQRHFTYDVSLYGATRKKGFLWEDGPAVIVPGSFAVCGMNISSLWNISKYFRTGLSLDAQFDESANIFSHVINPNSASEDVRFHRPPFREQFAVGISARAEIVMPIFAINIGVGRNVFCKGPDTDSFYQIFALKTAVTRNLFVHIGYQLYKFKTPNNLMLGLGWRFNARRQR